MLYILSLFFGASLTLSYAPFSYWAVMPIALTAYLCVLYKARPEQAAKLGFSFGLGWFGAGISWVHVSIADFGGLPKELPSPRQHLGSIVSAKSSFRWEIACRSLMSAQLPPVSSWFARCMPGAVQQLHPNCICIKVKFTGLTQNPLVDPEV